MTSLHRAAEEGNFEAFQQILSEGKISINATTSNGDSPLLFAAKAGSLKIVKFILDCGETDANQQNKGGVFLYLLKQLFILLLLEQDLTLLNI